MTRVLLSLLTLIMTVNGCGLRPFGSAPPPPMFATYYKQGFAIAAIQREMTDCGYKNTNVALRTDTIEDIAIRQACMLKKGFRFTGGASYICDDLGSNSTPSCNQKYEISR